MDPRAVADDVRELSRDLNRERGTLPFDLREGVACTAPDAVVGRELADLAPGTIGYEAHRRDDLWTECFELTDTLVIAK